MSSGSRARRVIWIPAFMVGVAASTAVATSAGILLYNAQGLPRAAFLIVTVAAASMVAGIWTGATAPGSAVASARRGWMGLLASLVVAALFAGAWEMLGGFGAAPLAQGLGLAVTAALPGYFAGGVWGRTAMFAGALGTPEVLQVVAGGAGGLIAGATTMMALWGQPVLAVTLFLGAAVLASAGARFQGWVFDRVPDDGPEP